jgi:hypothetical protein
VRIQAGIRHSMLFSEWDACIAAGLDVYEWFHGFKYSKEFKAEAIAHYSLTGDVSLHVEDARYRKQKRLSKRRR